MSDNVTKFYPANAAKSADNVLEQALGRYSEVLIVGWDHDGRLEAAATLGLKDGGDMLWLVEAFKFKLMNGDFVDEPSDA
jgi:hypothetical protein